MTLPALAATIDATVLKLCTELRSRRQMLALGLACVALVFPTRALHGERQSPRFAPLVFRCLLGGAARGKWLGPGEAARLVKGKERYRLYSLSGPRGTAVGGKPEEEGPPGQCADYYVVRSLPEKTLAVAAAWNAMPRIPVALAAPPPDAVVAVRKLLVSKRIRNPRVRIAGTLRVDLDGDGRDELLVSATFIRKFTDRWDQGEYSAVLLRRQDRWSLIQGEFSTEGKKSACPVEYTVVGVADADGDGKMEVLVAFSYYEGEGVTLNAVDGPKIEERAICSCGL